VASSFEHGSELSGFIKRQGILKLSNHQLLKKDSKHVSIAPMFNMLCGVSFYQYYTYTI
jgi:hypothetical protein